MTRSVWKNVYIESTLMYKLLLKNSNIIQQTNSRESTILKEFVGKTVNVYNGKQYFILNINNLMLGHKLGEFVHTKKICMYTRTKKVIKKYIKK